jgi:CRP-like cAMP-binding protein
VEALFNNISRYIQLTAEEQELISRRIAEKTFKRKQLLLQEGDICKHSYFVKSGCLRGYTIDKDGTEHNIVFAPQGWWIADMYSLITA